MTTFCKPEAFNRKFKGLVETMDWGLDIKSYEDLKNNPEAYCFDEGQRWMRFIVKDKEEEGKLMALLMFKVIDFGEEVRIDHMEVYRQYLEFMNRISAGKKWWI